MTRNRKSDLLGDYDPNDLAGSLRKLGVEIIAQERSDHVMIDDVGIADPDADRDVGIADPDAEREERGVQIQRAPQPATEPVKPKRDRPLVKPKKPQQKCQWCGSDEFEPDVEDPTYCVRCWPEIQAKRVKDAAAKIADAALKRDSDENKLARTAYDGCLMTFEFVESEVSYKEFCTKRWPRMRTRWLADRDAVLGGSERAPQPAPAEPRQKLVRPKAPATTAVDATGLPRGITALELLSRPRRAAGKRTIILGLGPTSVMLVAPPFEGKTFLAMHAAYAVANDRSESFLGQPVGTHGKVLYLALDQTEDQLKERVDVHFPGGRPDWLGNITFFARDTKPAFPLAKDGGMDVLRAWLGAHRPAMVVIDTLRRFQDGGEGQLLYQADYREADELRALAFEFDCIALISTHAGKKSNGSDPTKDVIGTSGLGAGTGAMMGLRHKKDSPSGTLTLQGNDVSYQRIPLAWDVATLTWRLGVELKGRPPAKMQAAIDFLKDDAFNKVDKLPQAEIETRSKDVCSWKTLNDAKKHLRITSTQVQRVWYWVRPKDWPESGGKN